jgi:hypothetical protein
LHKEPLRADLHIWRLVIEKGEIMTKLQRIYKALRVTTILSKRDCRYAAIKLAKMYEKGNDQ